MVMPRTSYRIGVSREFLGRDGDSFVWGDDIGLARIDKASGLSWRLLPCDEPLGNPSCLDGIDAMLVLRQRITTELLDQAGRLRHVSRWGAGLDRIDLGACSARGVLVTNSPLGGERPVAAAALTMVLALTHRLVTKDKLVREGKWQERSRHMGTGLTGKTIGIIGLGHIGREFARLVAPFEARLIACSPHADLAQAAELGVSLVELPTLLGSSDVVIVTCALTRATRGLLRSEQLRVMKSSAYLVNVARGEIVDEAALIDALRDGRIAGAGLDVFEAEPLPPEHPLCSLDNVLLSPHALAWTDEIVAGNARDAIGSLVDVACGYLPRFVANPDVLKHPNWAGLIARAAENKARVPVGVPPHGQASQGQQ